MQNVTSEHFGTQNTRRFCTEVSIASTETPTAIPVKTATSDIAMSWSMDSGMCNEKSLGRQGRVSAEARVWLGGLRGARPRRWPSHLGRQGRVSAEAPRYAVSLRGTVMKPPLW